MNDNTNGPKAQVFHLRQVDDAGKVHLEGIFTGAWFEQAVLDEALVLEGNIRPDWITGKMGAKTRRKVDRWTEELLRNNAVMGNLSIRLDPSQADYELAEDEDGDFTLTLWNGAFDTGVDSQSRITSILKACANPLGSFKKDTRFATRIWIADEELAKRVGSDYNTRGDKVNDTAAKFAFQDSPGKKLAKALLDRSPHLGIDNVEVLSNTVSASSSKLVAFNTLTQAVETFWSDEPGSDDEFELQADFLVRFWEVLAAVRPEFGRLGKSARQALRGSSMAGTALTIHGVIAVADGIFRQRLDIATTLEPLAHTVSTERGEVDYFSYENPTWARIGALVSSETRGGEARQTLRMSFQTRKAVADELKRHLQL
jgi:hypothetical protein